MAGNQRNWKKLLLTYYIVITFDIRETVSLEEKKKLLGKLVVPYSPIYPLFSLPWDFLWPTIFALKFEMCYGNGLSGLGEK